MEEFIFYIIKLNLFVGGAVAAACILDRFLRRKYSVRWRYILWLCIAALLLVPVDLSKSYAVWEVQIPVQQTQTGNGKTVLVKDGTYTGELQTDIQEVVVGTGETKASDEKDRFAENEDQGSRGIPSEWIYRGVFTVWIGGALLLAAWRSISFVAALKRLRRWSIPEVSEEAAALYEEVCRRYGKGRAPKLMVNEELSGPLLSGTFRTCLYLPDAVYTKRELRMIFAHELCHYYRRDLWYKMLLYAAATVYWFNPAMILLLREADRDLELLCDAQVTAGKSREYCLAYNRLLLKTAASSHGNLYYLSSSMNDGVADFKRRIVNIMGAKKLKRGLIPALLLSVTLVGVNALVGCTADREAKKETSADTEAVLEPEDENMAEAGMNENEPESKTENSEETGVPDNTADVTPDDATGIEGTPEVLEPDSGGEELENGAPGQQGKSTGEDPIDFPKNRVDTYVCGSGCGPCITIHEIRDNTVIFSLRTLEISDYQALDRVEATIVDQDTIAYKDDRHDLTMHWEPLSWGEFEEGYISPGAIHVSGIWPEECQLNSEMEYMSGKDTLALGVS